MVYDENTDPETLFYSAVVLYKFEIQATIIFQYTDVRFQIWDYFTNLTNSDTLQVRFSVYNPLYYMPSLATLNLKLNIPPINCQISIRPSKGISLTDNFNFKIFGCFDEELPLLYRFALYFDESEYQAEILDPINVKRYLLSDYQPISQVNNKKCLNDKIK
jgi:proprotein convertase subtilisin/kexin type 5